MRPVPAFHRRPSGQPPSGRRFAACNQMYQFCEPVVDRYTLAGDSARHGRNRNNIHHGGHGGTEKVKKIKVKIRGHRGGGEHRAVSLQGISVAAASTVTARICAKPGGAGFSLHGTLVPPARWRTEVRRRLKSAPQGTLPRGQGTSSTGDSYWLAHPAGGVSPVNHEHPVLPSHLWRNSSRQRRRSKRRQCHRGPFPV